MEQPVYSTESANSNACPILKGPQRYAQKFCLIWVTCCWSGWHNTVAGANFLVSESCGNKFQLCCLLAGWPKASWLTSLILTFFSFEKGVIINLRNGLWRLSEVECLQWLTDNEHWPDLGPADAVLRSRGLCLLKILVRVRCGKHLRCPVCGWVSSIFLSCVSFSLFPFTKILFVCLFVSTSKPLPGEKVQCNLLQFAFGLSLSSVHFHKLGKGRQSLLFNLRIQVTLFLATGLNNENSCRSNGGVMCALEDLLGAGKAKN